MSGPDSLHEECPRGGPAAEAPLAGRKTWVVVDGHMYRETIVAATSLGAAGKSHDSIHDRAPFRQTHGAQGALEGDLGGGPGEGPGEARDGDQGGYHLRSTGDHGQYHLRRMSGRICCQAAPQSDHGHPARRS